MRAFLQAQSTMNSDAITNIIAIGDNQIELDAGLHLASQFSNAFIKTIKFRECPTIAELTKQIRLILEQFEQIIFTCRNQTIRLQKCSNSPDTSRDSSPRGGVQSGLEYLGGKNNKGPFQIKPVVAAAAQEDSRDGYSILREINSKREKSSSPNRRL